MKRFSIFIYALTFSLVAVGQGNSRFYFDIGAKGGYGLTLLLNKNIFDDKHVVSELSFAPSFGGRLGGNFNEQHSLNVEVLYSVFNQAYSIKTDSLTWNKSISFTSLDLALLYRNFVQGSYVEIGPEFAFINKATENNSRADNKDILKEFVPNYFAGVFGFGANFLGNDNVGILAGLRATYCFTDVISDLGGKSQANSYPFNDGFYKSGYTSYKTSNPLTIRFILEVSFDLGYFTRSTCNRKRAKFLAF